MARRLTAAFPNDGSVFELMRSQGSWSFSTLYAFATQYCGSGPLARDPAGNLYGTCCHGGLYNPGGVFKLTTPVDCGRLPISTTSAVSQMEASLLVLSSLTAAAISTAPQV